MATTQSTSGSSSASENDNALPRSHERVSLETLLFLYQVLVALAMTNGMFVFFTGGTGTYELRPWDSYTPLECGLFAIFIATLTLFAHTNSLIIHLHYRDGFGGKGLQPIVDYGPLFVQAGFFYVLSHTFAEAQKTTDPLIFFKIMALLFVFDVVWALASVALEPTEWRTLSYGLLNMAVTAIGVALYVIQYANLAYWLLGLLAG
ncbi:MAG: hypothetical protein ABI068_02450, partial [Ktedonobacterales bacterium]